MLNEYLKSGLDYNGKCLYEQMVRVFKSGGDTVDCGDTPPDKIFKTYAAVNFDHPEFFYLSHIPQVVQRGGIGALKSTLISKKLFSDREIREYTREIDCVKQKISYAANSASSIEEKEKTVCDYVIEHCTYEIDNTYNQNAATVLVKGKGQCSGIAKAVKLLFDHLDIPCLVINGDAEDRANKVSGPHSWNIVKINNEYYHLDVTFMLGANPVKTKPYRYMYFNISDSRAAENHVWDKKQYPPCSGRTSAENYSPSSCGRAVSSLYELRTVLKREFENRAKTIEIASQIKADSQEDLMRMVSSTVRGITSGSSLKARVSIRITDNLIGLVVEY